MTNKKDATKRIQSFATEWNKIGANLHKSLLPQIEAIESIRQSAQTLAQSREIAEAAKAIQRFNRIQVEQAERFASSLTKFNEYVSSIHRQIAPSLSALAKTFEELPPKTQRALLELAAHGWYLDPELPPNALWQIEEALLEGNVLEAETELVNYYEGRLDEIERRICDAFPSRERFISTAFRLHREAAYAASIPLMLAQTDGICFDVTSQNFFRKRRGRPRTAEYVDRIASQSYLAALMSPLAHPLPIAASEEDRDPNSNLLNRHTILHGESLDYDSLENAARAVSLLHYVSWILTRESHREELEDR